MRTTLFLCLFLLFLGAPVTQAWADVELKSGFVQQLLTDQLSQPTSLTTAVDGRVFVTEKSGQVRIIENGVLLSAPLLQLQVDQAGERGLGSIMLDPDFDTNGYFYVYYTVWGLNFNRISRFTANGNLASLTSEVVILELPQLTGSIHNGGAMRIGPDGKLYVSIGDGLSSANAQNTESLLGKMIRINLDGSIPSDNPFYNTYSGPYRAIYASGLRNPFTFDLHRTTGQILLNDVGQSDWEEVNNIQAGKNYGWPLLEGALTTQTPPVNYQDPHYAYPHGPGIGCAVVGGAFYTPDSTTWPVDYMDKYIFSDYCNGIVQVMDPATGILEDTLIKDADYLSNLWVGQDGALYYLRIYEGEIWRVDYAGDGSPFIAKQPQTTLAVVGETALFHTDVIGNATLQYNWYVNGQWSQSGENLVLSGVQLSDSGSTVYCIVSNSLGTISTDTVELLVTANQRPVPTIVDPSSGTTYDNGDTIYFSGGAMDAEDGQLTPSSLEWKVDFMHDAHSHPGMPATSGIANGYFVVPRIGETDTNVWYRFHLETWDSQGLEQSVFRDIFPNLTTVEFSTTPGNFDLNLDGQPISIPYSLRSAVGNTRILAAPEIQIRNDSLFRFSKWSNGSTDPIQTFNAGDQASFTAEYTYVRRFFTGSGDGLTGTYYPNYNFDNPSAYRKIDPEINFFWDFESPLGSPIKDSVSIRWEGSIQPPITGLYVLGLEYDDKIKLFLNGKKLIDGNNSTIYQEDSVYLLGGQRYNIRIDFVELRWSARAKLLWRFPDQIQQIVPQQFLYSERYQVGQIDSTETSQLKIYPSPADNTLYFHCKKSTFPDEVEVYDLKGAIIRKEDWFPRTFTFPLDISDLRPGVYVAKVRTGDSYIFKRFLKN